jgi:hypothetical protein
MLEKFLFTFELLYRICAPNLGFLPAKGGLAYYLDPFCYLFMNIGGFPPEIPLYFAPWPKYDFYSGLGPKLLKLNSFYPETYDLAVDGCEIPA